MSSKKSYKNWNIIYKKPIGVFTAKMTVTQE